MNDDGKDMRKFIDGFERDMCGDRDLPLGFMTDADTDKLEKLSDAIEAVLDDKKLLCALFMGRRYAAENPFGLYKRYETEGRFDNVPVNARDELHAMALRDSNFWDGEEFICADAEAVSHFEDDLARTAATLDSLLDVIRADHVRIGFDRSVDEVLAMVPRTDSPEDTGGHSDLISEHMKILLDLLSVWVLRDQCRIDREGGSDDSADEKKLVDRIDQVLPEVREYAEHLAKEFNINE